MREFFSWLIDALRGIGTSILILLAVALGACTQAEAVRDSLTEPEPPPPPGAVAALATAQAVFERDLGAKAPVTSVTWVTDDQCGVGVPSIRVTPTLCAKGRALDCDIYVAQPKSGRWSQSALANELAHCHAYAHTGDSRTADQLPRYAEVENAANAALRESESSP